MSETTTRDKASTRPTEQLASIQMTLHDDGVTHLVKCPDCAGEVGQVVFGEGASIEDERNAIASLNDSCVNCGAQIHDYEAVPAMAADMSEVPAQ